MVLARGVREWIAGLAASEPRRAVETMARGCRHPGRPAGVDPEAVRRWAVTGVVSTGLFLLGLRHEGEAEPHVRAAGGLAGTAR